MSVNPIISPAGTVDPAYGLFSCQVGLSVGACYDPYQMRHAYGIDPLIAAGFDRQGKDDRHRRRIPVPEHRAAAELLQHLLRPAGLERAWQPADPSLGTFTQVAPDGLTPFVTGDANMTGWAEEISLDVLWAHAIAPGANITLVLAKSNNDADILSATKYAVDHDLGDVISQSFGENESCVDPRSCSRSSTSVRRRRRRRTSRSSPPRATRARHNRRATATRGSRRRPRLPATRWSPPSAARSCTRPITASRARLRSATNPAPGTYQGEIVWNEGPPFGDFQAFFDSTVATGGGFSVLYDEPSYQQGTLHGGKQRGVPDVSYNAAVLHGVLTYLNIPGVPAGFYRFGGTSAGSPQWAAITGHRRPEGRTRPGLHQQGPLPHRPGPAGTTQRLSSTSPVAPTRP